MRISDWSSDVCSSDLDAAVCVRHGERGGAATPGQLVVAQPQCVLAVFDAERRADRAGGQVEQRAVQDPLERLLPDVRIEPEIRADVLGGGRRDRTDAEEVDRYTARGARLGRSEEHTSELQSLMRISYAVFCLKKKKTRATRMS